MRSILLYLPLSLYCATPPNSPREEIMNVQQLHIQIRLTQSGEGQVEKVLDRKLVLMQMQEKANREKKEQEKK